MDDDWYFEFHEYLVQKMDYIKHFLKQALTTMITGLQRTILIVTETYCAIA